MTINRLKFIRWRLRESPARVPSPAAHGGTPSCTACAVHSASRVLQQPLTLVDCPNHLHRVFKQSLIILEWAPADYAMPFFLFFSFFDPCQPQESLPGHKTHGHGPSVLEAFWAVGQVTRTVAHCRAYALYQYLALPLQRGHIREPRKSCYDTQKLFSNVKDGTKCILLCIGQFLKRHHQRATIVAPVVYFGKEQPQDES